jgi:hypothetical protein
MQASCSARRKPGTDPARELCQISRLDGARAKRSMLRGLGFTARGNRIEAVLALGTPFNQRLSAARAVSSKPRKTDSGARVNSWNLDPERLSVGFGKRITVLEMAALEEKRTQDTEAEGPSWQVPLSHKEKRLLQKVLDITRPTPALEAGSDDDEDESPTVERSAPIRIVKPRGQP